MINRKAFPIAGLIVCLTGACSDDPAAFSVEVERGAELCRDGQDNDQDRLIDCQDPDCGDQTLCQGAGGNGGEGGPRTDGTNTSWPTCATAQGEAEAIGGGVDIIWVIDTSSSMKDETAWVQQNLNDFAGFIGGQNLDYRVVLIGESTICVAPPLGGAGCTDGTRYRHVPQKVSSTESLKQIISTYPLWQDFIRPDTTKNFIVVTDDNSVKDAAWFDSELALLSAPGFASGYVFHSIVSFGADPHKGCATGASPGEVYLELTQKTNGVKFQICEKDWKTIFANLAQSVARTARLPCRYPIPNPGENKRIDFKRVSVSYDRSGQSTALSAVAEEKDCGTGGGWYYDDPSSPTAVMLCPDTCDALSGGKILVTFGCLLTVE